MSGRNLQIDSYSVRLGVVLMFLEFFDYYTTTVYMIADSVKLCRFLSDQFLHFIGLLYISECDL